MLDRTPLSVVWSNEMCTVVDAAFSRAERGLTLSSLKELKNDTSKYVLPLCAVSVAGRQDRALAPPAVIKYNCTADDVDGAVAMNSCKFMFFVTHPTVVAQQDSERAAGAQSISTAFARAALLAMALCAAPDEAA